MGLIALFAGGDLLAHYTKYKYGETFSAWVWWLEKAFPFTRVVVGVILAVLFSHLEFHHP